MPACFISRSTGRWVCQSSRLWICISWICWARIRFRERSISAIPSRLPRVHTLVARNGVPIAPRSASTSPTISSARPYIGDESTTRPPAARNCRITSTCAVRFPGSTSNACHVPSPTVGMASLVLGIGRVFIVEVVMGLLGEGAADPGPRANAAGAHATIPEAAAIRRTSRREYRAIARSYPPGARRARVSQMPDPCDPCDPRNGSGPGIYLGRRSGPLRGTWAKHHLSGASVGVDHGDLYSSAPMSRPAPCGRTSPSMSMSRVLA